MRATSHSVMRSTTFALFAAALLGALGVAAPSAFAQGLADVPVDGKFHVVGAKKAAAAKPTEIRLLGRVVTPEGNPVAQARVELRQWNEGVRVSGAAEERASDAGEFEVAASVRGDWWRVTATAPGFVSGARSGSIKGTATRDVGTIVLERPHRLEGRVVDDEGRAVAGAAVHLGRGKQPVSDEEAENPDARTDPFGRFDFAAPAGTHRLGVARAGFADHVSEIAVGLESRRDMEIVVAPTPARSIEGRVLDADGAGVAGVTVVVARRRGFWRPRAAVTDVSGRFRVDGCAADGEPIAAMVKTVPAGYRLATMAEDGSLVLPRNPEVRVRAVREGTGEPLEILGVRVRDASWPTTCGMSEVSSWRSSFGGASPIKLLPSKGGIRPVVWTRFFTIGAQERDRPGKVIVVASDGSISRPIPIEADRWSRDLKADATVELPAAGAIVGRIVAPDGGPGRGLRVELSRRAPFDSQLTLVRAERADDDGAFRFDGVGAGYYVLELPGARVPSFGPRGVESRSGETTDAGSLRWLPKEAPR